MSLISVSQHITDCGRVFVEIVNCSGVEPPASTTSQGVSDAAAKYEPPCSVVYALRTSHPHLFYFRGDNDLINTFNSSGSYSCRQRRRCDEDGNTPPSGVDGSDAMPDTAHTESQLDAHRGSDGGRGDGATWARGKCHGNPRSDTLATPSNADSPMWPSDTPSSIGSVEAISERVWKAHGFHTFGPTKPSHPPASRHWNSDNNCTSILSNHTDLAAAAPQQQEQIVGGSDESGSVTPLNTTTTVFEPTSSAVAATHVSQLYHGGGGGGYGSGEVSMGLRPQLVREKMPEGILLPGDRRLFLLDMDDPAYLRELFLQKQVRQAQATSRGPMSNSYMHAPGGSLVGNDSSAQARFAGAVMHDAALHGLGTQSNTTGEKDDEDTTAAAATAREAIRFDACRGNLPQVPLFYVYYERLANGASCADVALKWFDREQQSYDSWCDKYVESIVHMERQWQLYAMKLLQKIQSKAPLSTRHTILDVVRKPSLLGTHGSPAQTARDGASHVQTPTKKKKQGWNAAAGADDAAAHEEDDTTRHVHRNDGTDRATAKISSMAWLALLRQRKEIPSHVSRSLYRRIIPPVLGSPIRWRRNTPTTSSTVEAAEATSTSTGKHRGNAQEMQATRVATVTDSTNVALPLWYYYDTSDLASLMTRLCTYSPVSLEDWADVLRRCSRERNCTQAPDRMSKKEAKSRAAQTVKPFVYSKPVLFSETHTNSLSKTAQKMFNMKQVGGGIVIAPLDGQALLRAFDHSRTDSPREYRERRVCHLHPSMNHVGPLIDAERTCSSSHMREPAGNQSGKHGGCVEATTITTTWPEEQRMGTMKRCAAGSRAHGTHNGEWSDLVEEEEEEEEGAAGGTVAWVEDVARQRVGDSDHVLYHTSSSSIATTHRSGPPASVAGSGTTRRGSRMQPGGGLALLCRTHSRSQSLQMVQKQQQLLLRMEHMEQPPPPLLSLLPSEEGMCAVDGAANPSSSSVHVPDYDVSHVQQLAAPSPEPPYNSVPPARYESRLMHMDKEYDAQAALDMGAANQPPLPLTAAPSNASSSSSSSLTTSRLPRWDEYSTCQVEAEAMPTYAADAARNDVMSEGDIRREGGQRMIAASNVSSLAVCNNIINNNNADATTTTTAKTAKQRLPRKKKKKKSAGIANPAGTAALTKTNSPHRRARTKAGVVTKSKRQSGRVGGGIGSSSHPIASATGYANSIPRADQPFPALILHDDYGDAGRSNHNKTFTTASLASIPAQASMTQELIDPEAVMRALQAQVDELPRTRRDATDVCATILPVQEHADPIDAWAVEKYESGPPPPPAAAEDQQQQEYDEARAAMAAAATCVRDATTPYRGPVQTDVALDEMLPADSEPSLLVNHIAVLSDHTGYEAAPVTRGDAVHSMSCPDVTREEWKMRMHMLPDLVRPVSKNVMVDNGDDDDDNNGGLAERTQSNRNAVCTVESAHVADAKLLVIDDKVVDAAAPWAGDLTTEDADMYAGRCTQNVVANVVATTQSIATCAEGINERNMKRSSSGRNCNSNNNKVLYGYNDEENDDQNNNDVTRNNVNGVSNSGNATSAIENVQFIYLMTHDPMRLLQKVAHRIWNRVAHTPDDPPFTQAMLSNSTTTSTAMHSEQGATLSATSTSSANVSFTRRMASRGLQHIVHLFTASASLSTSSRSSAMSLTQPSPSAVPRDVADVPAGRHAFQGALYVEFVIALLNVILNVVTSIPVSLIDRYGFLVANVGDTMQMAITECGSMACSLSTFVVDTVLKKSNVSLMRTVMMPLFILFSSVILFSSIRHVWYTEHDVYFMYDAT